MSHTLLLIQPTRKLESRTYGDFESLNEEMVKKTPDFFYQGSHVHARYLLSDWLKLSYVIERQWVSISLKPHHWVRRANVNMVPIDDWPDNVYA